MFFMQRFYFVLICALVVACEHKPVVPGDKGTGGNIDTSAICSPDTVYFANDILPLIISNCAMPGCHDAASHQDDIVLDNYSNIMSNGEIRPGRPDNSKLYEVITDNDPDNRMPPPPKSALPQDAIDKIAKWIQQGAKNNACNSGCDSAKASWTNDISKIISTSCLGCHSSGNVLLNSYDAVKTVALNGRLMGSLNHMPGYLPMPQGGSLSVCDINRFQKWVNNGAKQD